MKLLVSILLALVVAVGFVNMSSAGEHPGRLAKEHPGEHPGETAEHKEHPGTTHAAEHPGSEHPGTTAALSQNDIIKGIKDHINKTTADNGGVFPIKDSLSGKDLKLNLVKVHEDRVSYIKKEDAYFACTDFQTLNGDAVYDIDFWMKKGAGNKLSVYQTKIHKKDGTPRFVYEDDEIVVLEPGMAIEAHT